MDASHSSTTKPLYRGTQIVWYIVGVIQLFLAFRFMLKLLEANAGAGFTNFIYTITAPLVAPFVAVFNTTYVEGSIFEWTTLLAMAVYALVAWGIVNLFVMGMSVSTPEAATKLREQD